MPLLPNNATSYSQPWSIPAKDLRDRAEELWPTHQKKAPEYSERHRWESTEHRDAQEHGEIPVVPQP